MRISIHAPLTGSDDPSGVQSAEPVISIHAPLTGSDAVSVSTPKRVKDFNPRSPYGERPDTSCNSTQGFQFQSTLPLRGATRGPASAGVQKGISIHAPLTGSDKAMMDELEARGVFQSTLPLRGATGGVSDLCSKLNISIHAPLTGSDRTGPGPAPILRGISIHAPLTGSDVDVSSIREARDISIHAPLTGSDRQGGACLCNRNISIHAPLTGSDVCQIFDPPLDINFNPRSPYGERPDPIKIHAVGPRFQSTLPLRGATRRRLVRSWPI